MPEDKNLLLEKTRLTQLIDAFSESILAVAEDHTITLVNTPCEKLLGLKEENIIGKKVFDVLSFTDEKDKETDLQSICFTNNEEISNLKLKTNSGNYWVNVQKSVIVTPHMKKECVITISDITHLKELEKTKDEFLSVASHELRTPMTIIKSYLWMVNSERHGKLTEKQKEYISKAILSTERMIKLINDFLNISKIEENKISFEINRVEVIELLNELLIDMRLKANEKGLKLNQVNEKDKIYAFVDTSKLREIILNLVSNAIKFTNTGEIKVVASEEDGFAKIQVIDPGIGLRPDEIERLFLKFGRLDNSYQTVAESGGTGLGLYIVKRYIEGMNGKIGVTSDGEGKGSDFWFTLPLLKNF